MNEEDKKKFYRELMDKMDGSLDMFEIFDMVWSKVTDEHRIVFEKYMHDIMNMQINAKTEKQVADFIIHWTLRTADLLNEFKVTKRG